MEWSSPLEALEAVLELEKTVNGSLLAIHKEAEDRHDAHLEDYLESEFLEDQVGEIKKTPEKKKKNINYLKYAHKKRILSCLGFIRKLN